MKKILRFIKSETEHWPIWWRNLPRIQRWLPIVLIGLYWGALFALKGFRPDHLFTGLLLGVLLYGGRAARFIFTFIFPVILTGIIYDSQRFYGDFLRGEIHVELPYLFDKKFFGIETLEGRLTPNEWFQKHTHPVLDLITGFFYLFFITIYVAICVWHYFIFPKVEKNITLQNKAKRIGPYMTWSFFWLNTLGYSTYYWFPAAPPWYVEKYGLGPARLDAAASAAGCLRFDALLGTHFFTEMYGRSADVFGAIPSLHVAYPFLSMLYAYQLKSLRAFATFFYLIMCFSAIYLNHHYILDILRGTIYALLIWWLIDKYSLKQKKKKALHI